MPAIVVREVKPIDLPTLLRAWKTVGYKKGRWECIPGSDLIRVTTWKLRGDGKK